jgi:CRISPR-associated exonuclease Cas4
MINVSWIVDYNYCPLKIYLKHIIGEEGENYFMTLGKIRHEVRRSFEEITKRNIWSLNENMDLKEIKEALFEDVPQIVKEILNKYPDVECSDPDLPSNEKETLNQVYEDLMEDLELDNCFITYKVKKILQWSGKPHLEILDMLFPASLLEFNLQNQELNLKGKVDKIEMMEGYYYPVEVKNGKPPVKGVWKSHALQIAAYALLIEEEFKKEVPVGFVDYLQIGDRRTVILNNKLMEELFTILTEINSVIEDGYTPEIVQNPKKCRACDYSDFCEYRND